MKKEFFILLIVFCLLFPLGTVFAQVRNPRAAEDFGGFPEDFGGRTEPGGFPVDRGFPREDFGPEPGFNGPGEGFPGNGGGNFDYFEESARQDFDFHGISDVSYARSFLSENVEERISAQESLCLDGEGRKSLVESVMSDASSKLSEENPCTEIKEKLAEMREIQPKVCSPSADMFDDMPEEFRERMKQLFENPTKEGFIAFCKEQAQQHMEGEQFGPNSEDMKEDLAYSWDSAQEYCQQREQQGGYGNYPQQGQYNQYPRQGGNCEPGYEKTCRASGGFIKTDSGGCHCEKDFSQPRPMPSDGICTPELIEKCNANKQYCDRGQCVGEVQQKDHETYCRENPSAPECQQQAQTICGDGVCNEFPETCPADCPKPPACGDGICNEDPATCTSDCPTPTGTFPLLQAQVYVGGQNSAPGGYSGPESYGGSGPGQYGQPQGQATGFGFPGGGAGGQDFRQFHKGPDPCSQSKDDFINEQFGQMQERMEKEKSIMSERSSKMMERTCDRAAEQFLNRVVREKEMFEEGTKRCGEGFGKRLAFMEKALAACEENTQPDKIRRGWIEPAVQHFCGPVKLEAKLKARLARIDELEKELGAREEQLAKRLEKLARLEEKLTSAAARLSDVADDISESNPVVGRVVKAGAEDYTAAADDVTTSIETAQEDELNLLESVFFGRAEEKRAVAEKFARLAATREELESTMKIAIETGDQDSEGKVRLELENVENITDDLKQSSVEAVEHNTGFFERLLGFNPEKFVEEHKE